MKAQCPECNQPLKIIYIDKKGEIYAKLLKLCTTCGFSDEV